MGKTLSLLAAILFLTACANQEPLRKLSDLKISPECREIQKGFIVEPTIKVREGVLPFYPRGLQQRRVDGCVRLLYSILPNGRVEQDSVKVLKSFPENKFENWAEKALKKWSFEKVRDQVAQAEIVFHFQMGNNKSYVTTRGVGFTEDSRITFDGPVNVNPFSRIR